MQGSLSIERMCQMGQVSRAGFYRSLKEQRPVEEDMEVRSAIQQIAVCRQNRIRRRPAGRSELSRAAHWLFKSVKVSRMAS